MKTISHIETDNFKAMATIAVCAYHSPVFIFMSHPVPTSILVDVVDYVLRSLLSDIDQNRNALQIRMLLRENAPFVN
jgi:hypothetical protein